ncbi:MAG TPA: hypothetical protein VFW89_04120 [Gemmatimonadaceae bacterium]|nr:hypothetical protein [Gemmatimonadaceae bacterium]
MPDLNALKQQIAALEAEGKFAEAAPFKTQLMYAKPDAGSLAAIDAEIEKLKAPLAAAEAKGDMSTAATIKAQYQALISKRGA